MSVDKSALLGKNQWPLGITCIESLTYKHEGVCQCCPYFFPMGVLSPCCLIGRIQTDLVDEEPCCCEMGPIGCCYCISTAPISIWGPLGGCVFFSLLAPCYRDAVRKKYELPPRSEGDNSCENDCLHAIWLGCNYSCVFFQLFMTIKHFRRRKLIENQKMRVPPPAVTANPLPIAAETKPR